MNRRAGLKHRVTAGPITQTWPPFTTQTMWTHWLNLAARPALLGLDCMMMCWTAGDGPLRTAASMVRGRQPIETGQQENPITEMDRSCVEKCSVVENGMIYRVTLSFKAYALFAMVSVKVSTLSKVMLVQHTYVTCCVIPIILWQL